MRSNLLPGTAPGAASDQDGTGKDSKSMREMLGTFSNSAGPSGNYISFEMVPNSKTTPTVLGAARSLNGEGHLHQMLGFEDLAFGWGLL